ncbi:MAG: ParB/RepB/Spo0J family partition protein [Xenococcaceae cyanobacterium]
MTKKTAALSKSFVGNSFAGASQAQKVDRLNDRIEELEAEITKLRANSIDIEEKQALEARIQELVTELSAKQGVEEIAIDVIERNPKQPRQTWTASSIQAIAESLNREGQHTPIILIPQPDCKYLLFDGERRWRGASSLGWKTIKAVMLPSEAKIDDNELRRKALLTTLHRENLHPLDLAECLIAEILSEYPYLVERKKEIPRILNTTMSRLERERKNLELAEIKLASREIQQSWLEEAKFKNFEERDIFEIVLGLQLNPASIDANVFPLLKLASDLKATIREEGLDASKARELDKLSAERLKVEENKALQIRSSNTRQVIDEKYSLSQTKKLVKQLIAQNNSIKTASKQSLKMDKFVQSIREVNIKQIELTYLKTLKQVLQEKLHEIEKIIK